MDGLEIITTSDGSHTLRNTLLKETYHSIHGAVQESMHVFVGNGLQYYCEMHQPAEVSILEVGFGTGLNALLTLQYAINKPVRVSYATLEPFPLAQEVWSKLNYGEVSSAADHFQAIHKAEWDKEVPISPLFSILKKKTSLQEVVLHEEFDVIYFDAFAPSIQPELWAFAALEKVVTHLKWGGVFVTYSAKGQLKRDLRSLALTVDILPGPPGKNEMVRARRRPKD